MIDDNSTDAEVLAWLEEQGAIEWDGMDDTGDRVFKVNVNKIKEVYPEMYEIMTRDVNQSLQELYKLGLVDVSYDENLEPIFSISDEGRRIMEKYGYVLGEEYKND